MDKRQKAQAIEDGTETWEDVGNDGFLKWEAPVTVRGEYLGHVETDGKFGRQKRHVLLTADRGRVAFFAPSVLGRKLASINPGDIIQIVFDGAVITTSTGRIAKDFDVKRLLLANSAENKKAAMPSTGAAAQDNNVPF